MSALAAKGGGSGSLFSLQVRDGKPIHLENDGFNVQGVATGKELFASIEKRPADLIILDLNLPDGDGLDFAAKLRETQSTPIIIASARKGMEDRLTALNMGAIDYVTKPFDPQELLIRIKNLLNITSTQKPENTSMYQTTIGFFSSFRADFHRASCWSSPDFTLRFLSKRSSLPGSL